MTTRQFKDAAVASRCDRVLQGTTVPKRPSYSFRGSDQQVPSLVTNTPFVGSSKQQHYTGTAMIGIAVAHKSNLVPVFSTEAANDLAHMRR